VQRVREVLQKKFITPTGEDLMTVRSHQVVNEQLKLIERGDLTGAHLAG
jgi:hypothetical protein